MSFTHRWPILFRSVFVQSLAGLKAIRFKLENGALYDFKVQCWNGISIWTKAASIVLELRCEKSINCAGIVLGLICEKSINWPSTRDIDFSQSLIFPWDVLRLACFDWAQPGSSFLTWLGPPRDLDTRTRSRSPLQTKMAANHQSVASLDNPTKNSLFGTQVRYFYRHDIDSGLRQENGYQFFFSDYWKIKWENG